MPHKFDPKRMECLHDAQWRQLDPGPTLDLLPLAPHQKVADIGCGTGFFTIPLAQRLPQGRVYGVDVSEDMLARFGQRVAEAKLPNIEAVRSQEQSIPLPDGSLDGALLAFVLHEAEDRAALLSEVKRLLRLGGWVGLVEWQKKDTGMGPPLHDRLDAAEARELMEKVGLKLERAHPLGDKFYLLVMRNRNAH